MSDNTFGVDLGYTARIFMTLSRVGLTIGLVITTVLAHAAPLAGATLARALVDRDDTITGPQIHVIYAVPADGVDRELDTNGPIATAAASLNRRLGDQSGRHLRLDTFAGELDVAFLQCDTIRGDHRDNQQRLGRSRHLRGGARSRRVQRAEQNLRGVLRRPIRGAVRCGPCPGVARLQRTRPVAAATIERLVDRFLREQPQGAQWILEMKHDEEIPIPCGVNRGDRHDRAV